MIDKPWWSADVAICGYIAATLSGLRDGGTCYPSSMRGHEEWVECLDAIIAPLKAYSDGNFERSEILLDAREALRAIADHLPDLWD